MRRILSICFLSFFLFLSSCAVYHGGQMLAFEPNTSDFKVVNNINAQSTSATYVLGIGGLYRTSLLKEAKQKITAYKFR